MKSWTLGQRIAANGALLITLIAALRAAAFHGLGHIRRTADFIGSDNPPGLIACSRSHANTPANFSNVLLSTLAQTSVRRAAASRPVRAAVRPTVQRTPAARPRPSSPARAAPVNGHADDHWPDLAGAGANRRH